MEQSFSIHLFIQVRFTEPFRLSVSREWDYDSTSFTVIFIHNYCFLLVYYTLSLDLRKLISKNLR